MNRRTGSDENANGAARRHLSIESGDQEELSDYFSSRVSQVRITPAPKSENLSINATVVPINDIVAFTNNVSSGARFRQAEDLTGFMVQVPLHGSMQMRRRTDELLLGPASGFLGRIHEGDLFDFAPGWRHLAVKIPYESITKSLSQLLDEPLFEQLDFQSSFDPSSHAGKALASLLEVAVAPIGDAPMLEASPAAAKQFADCIKIFILENFQHNYSSKLSSGGHSLKPRYVKRAMDFIRANAALPLTLEEIATAAGISPRALHYGFKQFQGMSPFEYLKVVRLEAAYAELQTAPEETTIADIARKWGFANTGRFALYCRNAFGISPSEIRRTRRTRTRPKSSQ